MTSRLGEATLSFRNKWRFHALSVESACLLTSSVPVPAAICYLSACLVFG
jgi:hypothetical protein